MPATPKVALIGAGHMGGALAAGWLKKSRGGLAPDNFIIVDPRPGETAQALIDEFKLTRLDVLDAETAASVDVVVLAVKPQLLGEIAAITAPGLPEDTGLISIVAGPSLTALATRFGPRPMVRAMPNTAAQVGAGVSVCAANDRAAGLRKTAERLLKPAGSVEWVEDERLLGAVTAVSGSGPAYVFLLVEALAGAGIAEGLPRDLAEKLARQTVIGAGALLDKSDKPAQDLRRQVTSPGGTTQAALDVLMSGGGMPELVRHAVTAAERRSRKLGADNS